MFVDLLILTAIGCLLDGFATKMSGAVFAASPTFTFSMLIVFIATARWNLWGLLTIPFLAAATWLGGHYNDINYLAAVYDYRVYISTCLGLATLAVNVLFYKKLGNKKMTKSIPWLLLLFVLDYLLYSGVQLVSYRLLCGNIMGNEITQEFELWFDQVETINADGTKTTTTVALDEPVLKEVNLCQYVESGFIFNLFGFAVLVIGGIVLGSQGVLSNCREKFVEDKKEQELIQENTENFEISEAQNDSQESEVKEESTDSSERN